MPLSEDTPVFQSDFRLRHVLLNRCTKVRHEYEVIQSSEKTSTCEGLADASQHGLPSMRPYSLRRNALRQDRPGSGPGKENMNPDDATELCHKKAIPGARPTMRSFMRSSTRMTCESRSSLAMALEPQVESRYLSADQQRTLTTSKIDRCRKPAVANLTKISIPAKSPALEGHWSNASQTRARTEQRRYYPME